MGIASSCPKTKSNPKEAAGTASIVEGSKRYTVGSAVTGTGVDDYGAKYRFPLRKEPTIRFIATSFRAARHHNTRIIFWVDSNQTQENADLTLHLQARGITIERHLTTASALMSLRANKSYQVKQSLSLYKLFLIFLRRYSRPAFSELSQTGLATATTTRGRPTPSPSLTLFL